MKIQIKFTVTLERKHLIFAAVNNKRTIRDVKDFLRNQIEQFGTDDLTLMGDDFFIDYDGFEQEFGALVDGWVK
jgi:hypothetical protein